MAVIENFVKLLPGTAKRLHFKGHRVLSRQITDPILGAPVMRQSLVFDVDEEDGRPVSKMYSVVSERHAGEFAGYLPDRAYTRYTFTVIKDAPGTVPPRILEARPR